jgi:beta-glucanase (GH16 family)
MLSTPRVRAGDVLVNPGFELGQAVLGWNTYGANVYGESNAAIAHGGTNYLKVYQGFSGSVNYSGVYQDNLTGPGAVFAADGWAYTRAGDALAGQNAAWVEVTFRDATANVLALYRSALITTNALAGGAFPRNDWMDLRITNQYDPNSYTITNFTGSLVAPAGTSFVRYQVVFQGDANYSLGSVYFDDLNLAQTGGGPLGNWNIVWSDEFGGTSINTRNWTFETGNGSGGWGNNELEYYTSLPQNAYVSNGLLHIVALHQSTNGFNYTSARMKTEGLFSAQYGRFEFRAKLPTGAGYWPALWMMPEDSAYGGWAASGEIDVMENTGTVATNVFGTLHFGGAYPNQAQSYGPSYNFLSGDSVTNFHNYVLEWTTNAISWYLDGQLYETQTNWWSSSNPTNTSIQNPYPAPFNKPFYIIMNLAVGGTLGGTPNNSVFPGDMQVDYVRLYNLTAPLQLSAAAAGHNRVSLAWPTNIVCHLVSATNVMAANWTNVPGGTNQLVLSPNSSATFYRLISP